MITRRILADHPSDISGLVSLPVGTSGAFLDGQRRVVLIGGTGTIKIVQGARPRCAFGRSIDKPEALHIRFCL